MTAPLALRMFQCSAADTLCLRAFNSFSISAFQAFSPEDAYSQAFGLG
jgi:hypothetical protein